MSAPSVGVIKFGRKKYLIESQVFKRRPDDFTDAHGWVKFEGDTFQVGIQAQLNFEETARTIIHEAAHIAFTILQAKRKHPKAWTAEREEEFANLLEDITYPLLQKHLYPEAADDKQ